MNGTRTNAPNGLGAFASFVVEKRLTSSCAACLLPSELLQKLLFARCGLHGNGKYIVPGYVCLNLLFCCEPSSCLCRSVIVEHFANS